MTHTPNLAKLSLYQEPPNNESDEDDHESERAACESSSNSSPSPFLRGKPLFIYEGTLEKTPDADIPLPLPFNAQLIQIDASLSSSMDWKEAREKAQMLKEKNAGIFWELNLNLEQLPMPLDHQPQFLSLKIAVEHFVDTLWQEFNEHSVGVALYRGPIHLSQNLNSDSLSEWLEANFSLSLLREKLALTSVSFASITAANLAATDDGQAILRLFGRNLLRDFIDLLTSHLPENFAPYLLLDVQGIKPLEQAQLIAPDCFLPLNLAIKGADIAHPYLAWGDEATAKGLLTAHLASPSLPAKENESAENVIGLLLPSCQDYEEAHWQALEPALNWLNSQNMSYRLIPESLLIHYWEGLDIVLAAKEVLSLDGMRQLQGFSAALGTIVSLTSPLAIDGEIPFSEFKTAQSQS